MSRDGNRAAVPAKARAPSAPSMNRERLDSLLARLWSRRLCLVVAPAGSGKTTLLADFARGTEVPVAWYRAERWDGDLEAFLSHLQAALTAALGQLSDPWSSIEDAARAIERWPGRRAALVVDDLHLLEGTPAEAAFARLIECEPTGLWFLAASRAQPGFNLPRLRVSGALVEIGGDDLRFRSWEVEQLFRDFYHEPLPPVELAKLARRTEGWAAGLQLFHLATRDKQPEERLRLLDRLGGRSRLVQDYLTSNVIDQLPSALRHFLIETCLLGRLSTSICNRLLDREDSGLHLRELERRQIFIQPLGDDEGYRYHEVLRSHLEGALVHLVGETAVRQRFRRAGGVLEENGEAREALYAYCRAEDWPAVANLLGLKGPQLVQRPSGWIHALPTPVLQHDPWLMLARARRHRDEGLWFQAVADYSQAERLFDTADSAEICRAERQALLAWIEPLSMPTPDLVGQLRVAIKRDFKASECERHLEPAAAAVLLGLRALLAGRVDEARHALRSAPSRYATGAVAVAAEIGLGVAGLLAGDMAAAHALGRAVESAELLEIPFLARLGQACLSLAGGRDAVQRAGSVRFACERLGDDWGAALAGLLEGWTRVSHGTDEHLNGLADLMQSVAGWFERKEATVLEAWALGLAAIALARQNRHNAVALALKAEQLSNTCTIDGPRLLAYTALAAMDSAGRVRWAQLASTVRAATGMTIGKAEELASAEVHVRLFGGFEIMVGKLACDFSELRPRARTLLRLLAAQAGRPLHREAIQAILWPDADTESAAHNLHVTVSSLRKALEARVASAGALMLLREGDAYRLAFGQHVVCDLAAFNENVAAAGRARVARNLDQAVVHLQAAQQHYSGELLPEEGPADWVIEARDRCRTKAIEAAQSLAELLLDRGDPADAAKACVTGLHTDQYQDALWRLLIEARELAGDHGAARLARDEYGQVLIRLGVV